MFYAIYIPQSVPHGVHDWVALAMGNHFGGYTAAECLGGWANPATGDLVHETVTVIHAYGPAKESSANLMEELANEILRRSSEACVLYVIGWDGRTVERRNDHDSLEL